MNDDGGLVGVTMRHYLGSHRQHRVHSRMALFSTRRIRQPLAVCSSPDYFLHI